MTDTTTVQPGQQGDNNVAQNGQNASVPPFHYDHFTIDNGQNTDAVSPQPASLEQPLPTLDQAMPTLDAMSAQTDVIPPVTTPVIEEWLASIDQWTPSLDMNFPTQEDVNVPLTPPQTEIFEPHQDEWVTSPVVSPLEDTVLPSLDNEPSLDSLTQEKPIEQSSAEIIAPLEQAQVETPISITTPEPPMEPVVEAEPAVEEFSPELTMPESSPISVDMVNTATVPIEEPPVAAPEVVVGSQEQSAEEVAPTIEEQEDIVETPVAQEEEKLVEEEVAAPVVAVPEMKEDVTPTNSIVYKYHETYSLIQELFEVSGTSLDEEFTIVWMASDTQSIDYVFRFYGGDEDGFTITKINKKWDEVTDSHSMVFTFNDADVVLRLVIDDELALEENNYKTDNKDAKHYVFDKLNKFDALLRGNIKKIKKKEKKNKEKRKLILKKLRDF